MQGKCWVTVVGAECYYEQYAFFSLHHLVLRWDARPGRRTQLGSFTSTLVFSSRLELGSWHQEQLLPKGCRHTTRENTQVGISPTALPSGRYLVVYLSFRYG